MLQKLQPYIPSRVRIQSLAQWLPRARPSFQRLHVSYFIFFTIVGTVSLWLSPRSTTARQNISFIDALYNAASALSVTGLSSIAMHRFSSFDQVTLLFLMMLGSQVFTSWIILFIRSRVGDRPRASVAATVEAELSRDSPELSPGTVKRSVSMPVQLSSFIPSPGRRQCTTDMASSTLTEQSCCIEEGRTEIQKEPQRFTYSAGGKDDKLTLERRALVYLMWIVIGYFATFHILGFLGLLFCVLSNHGSSKLLRDSGLDPAFFSLFTTVSSFANAGYTQIDDNLAGFRRDGPALLWVAALILAGNTAYAPTLRAAVWCVRALTPATWRNAHESLTYVLESPRRCFTHLFPRRETRWLVMTVVVFNGVQTACVCGLDWWNSAAFGVTGSRVVGGDTSRLIFYKVVDAVFTSVSTRSAGMNVMNVGALSAPVLVLFAAMMYVAVYPVYFSRQRSRHVNSGHTSTNDDVVLASSEEIYAQCRELLARDSFYVFVATFLVCITERHAIHDDPLNFSVFNLLFEIISAYGNVGLSIGYNCRLHPSATSTCVGVSYSLSGKWSTSGKFILVVVMLLGRHRGLPDDIDWAVTPLS